MGGAEFPFEDTWAGGVGDSPRHNGSRARHAVRHVARRARAAHNAGKDPGHQDTACDWSSDPNALRAQNALQQPEEKRAVLTHG
ncbi:hypothetical protein A0H81_14961 [Grifola frondosa]|uniref:Uncharacterized protein n=1 Tax=Grifola frondosa TaxID=5627 RepID=A0A1C7LM93_GRIFR|nr:hypothetical protein A0H81_14961 [Grifola frondosa]